MTNGKNVKGRYRTKAYYAFLDIFHIKVLTEELIASVSIESCITNTHLFILFQWKIAVKVCMKLIIPRAIC